jgi:CBS domain-containing protein
MRVRDVMTQDVTTVAPDTDLRDVAALLVQERTSGVPVVERGRVVGVVSERDILFMRGRSWPSSTGSPASSASPRGFTGRAGHEC